MKVLWPLDRRKERHYEERRSQNGEKSAGAYGEVLHFNGRRWMSFRELTGIASGAYYGVSAKNKLVIAVGYESPRGIVARGYRR